MYNLIVATLPNFFSDYLKLLAHLNVIKMGSNVAVLMFDLGMRKVVFKLKQMLQKQLVWVLPVILTFNTTINFKLMQIALFYESLFSGMRKKSGFIPVSLLP